MNKKLYIQPVQRVRRPVVSTPVYQAAQASKEGIGWGGEGDDEDDPTAKERTPEANDWGNLW